MAHTPHPIRPREQHPARGTRLYELRRHDEPVDEAGAGRGQVEAHAWVAPSFRWTTAAVDGHSRSGVIVATMMQSTAAGRIPRAARQRRAAGTSRSDVPPAQANSG